MGIQGLIPFLDKSSKPTNVKQFSGSTVAVDAYCWLHKGVFSCADKLARGDDCQSYVFYCMKFVNMLLSYNIKPIIVFDGQKLPAKKNTEKKRKDLREQSRKKAAELMRLDKGKEALVYLRQSVDVTHEMALNFIRACRSRNVDCIVAPYEADAQLAYLNIQNIAQVIITEDSDLMLFGAQKVLFKMDINGNGLLIEHENLYLSMGERPENFSFDKFRYMCILSGCDYLPSLPGIGLAKACRFVKRTVDPDIYRAISRMGSHLNMPSLKVSQEYKDGFMDADFMFKYQPVFDPATRKLVPLTSVSEDDENYKKFSALIAENNLSSEQLCNLAYGNLDPFSLRQLDDWVPGQSNPTNGKYHGKKLNNVPSKHPSIWDPDFVPYERKEKKSLAPNALNPVKSTASTNHVAETSSSWFTKSNSKEDEIQSKQNLTDQLQKLKSMYEISRPKDPEEYDDSAISSGEETKSQNSSFSDKSFLSNSFTDQDSEVSAARLKIRSALSRFARSSYKSENDENLSDAVSCYFSSGSSPATDSPDIVSIDEISPAPKSLDESDVGSQSPVVQRSPLKVRNNDEGHHPISPVKIVSSSLLEMYSETGASSSAKKRLNPFAVASREKVSRFEEEKEKSSNVRSKSPSPQKKESTFKWTKSFESAVTNGCELSNERWSTNSLPVVAGSPTKVEDDEPEAEKQKIELSPVFVSTKINRSRNSLPARTGSKCRTPGLAKKPSLKQQSLLSAFICSKPQKLKL